MLDYVEFLESKYAERAAPTGILAKITETVEDTMRAAKLPVQAISGTPGDGQRREVMKGLAAAGQAVVDEAVKAAEGSPHSRCRPAAAKADGSHVDPHPAQGLTPPRGSCPPSAPSRSSSGASAPSPPSRWWWGP